MKVKLDFPAWRESRGSSPVRVLGIAHNFSLGKAKPGAVGWATIGYLSRRLYQDSNLSILLATQPPPYRPHFLGSGQ